MSAGLPLARFRIPVPWPLAPDMPYRFLAGPMEAVCWNYGKCFPLNRDGVPWPHIMEQLKHENPRNHHTYTVHRLAGLFHDIEMQQQLEGQRPLTFLLISLINIDLEMRAWSHGYTSPVSWYPELPMMMNPSFTAVLGMFPGYSLTEPRRLHMFVDFFEYFVDVNSLDDRDYVLFRFRSPRLVDNFRAQLYASRIDRDRAEGRRLPPLRKGFANHHCTRPVLLHSLV